jgi:hypothetical protein
MHGSGHTGYEYMRWQMRVLVRILCPVLSVTARQVACGSTVQVVVVSASEVQSWECLHLNWLREY